MTQSPDWAPGDDMRSQPHACMHFQLARIILRPLLLHHSSTLLPNNLPTSLSIKYLNTLLIALKIRAKHFTQETSMQRTPRRVPSARGPGGMSTPRKTPQSNRRHQKSSAARGLFSNGVWHCDCSPRLPAEHFKVKKEGKNQGRWFYTCQMSEGQRCGFFLWDEEAKVREEGAVLGNSRTEPGRTQEAGGLADAKKDTVGGGGRQGKGLFGSARGSTARSGRGDDSTQSPSPSAEKAPAGAKRKADAAGMRSEDDSDEAYPWPLTGQEEKELSTADNFETPRKAVKTGIYATPATSTRKRKLPWQAEQEEPQTPATSTSKAVGPKDYFGLADDAYLFTPSKAPTTAPAPIALPETPAMEQPPKTPSSPTLPTRHTNALANPADDTSTLTHNILSILSKLPSSLPPDVLSELRSTLTQFDLRTQGIAKGREISRLALKKKDVRIAELMGKVEGLQAEREVLRGALRGLRRDG